LLSVFIGYVAGPPHVIKGRPGNARFQQNLCFPSVEEYVIARSKILKAKKLFVKTEGASEAHLGSRGLRKD